MVAAIQDHVLVQHDSSARTTFLDVASQRVRFREFFWLSSELRVWLGLVLHLSDCLWRAWSAADAPSGVVAFALSRSTAARHARCETPPHLAWCGSRCSVVKRKNCKTGP